MAKPPEPIEEVLPQATWVVEAEVAEVLSTGPKPPAPPNAKPGATSVGYKSASQQVKLKVTNVLRGEKTSELVVQKPEHEERCRAMGITDFKKIYTSEDLASGLVGFGLRDGEQLLQGVQSLQGQTQPGAP